ncbi:hypothetical protein ABW20_dc0103170 [Dactylellina cionopaga]|nr:hypothetical protein ABW20_dc0103170 [Dactylellina cionopaga]
MADDSTPQVPEQTTPSDASLAQMTPLSVSEQARIRRELRKAKVGQGADRLRKITQTQRTAAGFKGEYKDESELSVQSTPTPASRTPTVESLSDTDIDISDHFYQPPNRPRDVPNAFTPPTPPSQTEFSLDNDQIAQMMQNHPLFGPPGGAAAGGPQFGSPPFGGSPFGGPEGPGGPGMDMNDPMLQLMQQMLGAAGAGGADGKDGGGGIPPDLLNSLLAGAGGPGGPPGAPQESVESPYAKWWTVVHILCSVLLGVYAVLSLPERYTGTKAERLRFGETGNIPLFWYFATMELVLQSTRYLLVERGGPPPNLILTTIVRFLPPPLGTAIVTLSHYFKIFSTVWRDILVLIFTIGMAAWVNTWFVEEEDITGMGI